ncbi:protein of unknown function [Candidatus Nitrosocosmicus franklandus]|uniref:Uncharacterized protein n=1 Tax=Candidatus Nitrosocosmicus franklandianus TaxID=1798806 RepID=A0A484IEU0_9ARCH|nr:protein of unknown function [Candidatus Nitrosocosmicus franklandus]
MSIELSALLDIQAVGKSSSLHSNQLYENLLAQTIKESTF